MTALYLVAAAAFFSVALRSSYSVAASLRRCTAAACRRAYESSKWAFVAVLALLTVLFLMRVVPNYADLIALFVLDLIGWRLTARYAISRRDIFEGASDLL